MTKKVLKQLLVLSCGATAFGTGTLAFAQQANLSTPNVSANALFLYRNSNFAKEDTSNPRNGADIQEAEIAYYADVDPDNRLNVLLTVHPEYKVNATTNRLDQEWKVEPEELYDENNQIPWTTLRVGKFKAALGKHNQLHTHAFPFVEQPLVNTGILGDEGLNDVGLSVAVLFPIPWFSEFTVQGFGGENGNAEFNSPAAGDMIGVGHWKNLFDLSDALTMEIGLSYAQGGNSLGGTTRITGQDLTFKWRPTEGGKYHSGIWAIEALQSRTEQGTDRPRGDRDGWDTWVQYQFAERWAALAREEAYRTDGAFDVGDLSNVVALTDGTTNKHSVAVVFNGSEFSSYKLEYDWSHGLPNPNAGNQTDERKIMFQANFTIGAHPAHAY